MFTYFVGNIRGGIPCAVVITCLFYGAISGSSPATVAAVGSMTIPVMLNLGYSLEFSAAVVTVAGGLGCIIPPSIPFVLYSTSAGTSVGDMFIAGIMPGLLLGVLLMIYAVYYCVRKGEDRERIHTVVAELRRQGFPAPVHRQLPRLADPRHHFGQHLWRYRHSHGGRRDFRVLCPGSQRARL